MAIAPDGRRFLLGTESSLRLFDIDGRQIWQSAAPSIAWRGNITGDGRFALGTFGDGTIRWYDMQDGRERLAFFTARSTRYTFYPHIQHWVAWVPEGFFASDDSDPPDYLHERWGSDEGDELVGYKLNRGAGQAPELIPVKRLYQAFYRPDLLLARLQGDEGKIEQARAAIGDVAGSGNE